MASPPDAGAHAGQADVPLPEEVGAQLTRILESGEFRSARNRARFLEYVVGRALEGACDSLKEYTIGVEVFDRGADFDPRADGVVRTHAGLVRKHLERYYATKGRSDPIEITLPKGHYVPRFERRMAGSAPPADPLPRRRRLWVAASIVATTMAALVVIGLVRGISGRSAPVAAQGEDVYGPVWGPFLKPGASNVLAFGIPQFFTGNGVWVRDVGVNSASPSPDSERLDAIRRQVGPLRPGEVYTGVGEAYGVHVLTRFFLGAGHDLRALRSPSMTWEGLKHDNVIFLASARFKTLGDRLSYPAEFVHVLGMPNRVRNVHPGPGEQAEYMVQSDPTPVDYAIVSVWPGKLPGRRIVVLSGSHTWGTQAAVEYVTEPAYAQDLRERLLACQRQKRAPSHPEFFQVLLRVEGRDEQPIGVTFVTHRDLAIDDTLGTATAGRSARAGSGR